MSPEMSHLVPTYGEAIAASLICAFLLACASAALGIRRERRLVELVRSEMIAIWTQTRTASANTGEEKTLAPALAGHQPGEKSPVLRRADAELLAKVQGVQSHSRAD